MNHTYEYDVAGRLLSDTVVASSIPVAGSMTLMESTITAHTFGYDALGRGLLFSSRDKLGNVRNEVKRVYDGLGHLVAEYHTAM